MSDTREPLSWPETARVSVDWIERKVVEARAAERTRVLDALEERVKAVGAVRLADEVYHEQTGERRPDDSVYRYEVLALIEQARKEPEQAGEPR